MNCHGCKWLDQVKNGSNGNEFGKQLQQVLEDRRKEDEGE